MARAFTVYYDEEECEVSHISFSEKFRAEHVIGKSDILQDAVKEVVKLYNASLKDWDQLYQPEDSDNLLKIHQYKELALDSEE